MRLRLAQPDDCGELYFNGIEVQKIEKYGPEFDVLLAPEQIKYGGLNSIAACISDWYVNGGINGDKLEIAPETGLVMIRETGKPDTLAKPEDFEMGAKPTKNIEIVFRFYGKLAEGEGQTLDYRIVDCFHRVVKEGNIPAKRIENGDIEVVVRLSPGEARKLFYGEWFNASALLKTSTGTPIKAFAWHEQKLKYEQRDKLALPDLPETIEDTPMGKLKLVDVIDCSIDPTNDSHPYKEGGVRAFWGGRRAYAPWKDGININAFKGRKYREANNEQHFGYRIGRGKLKPGGLYLLRILYPEDKTRYFAMDIQAGRNYQGVGFRTGVSEDNPVTPYPLSGDYQWCDHIVALDDVTYGYKKGRRSVPAENGFWVLSRYRTRLCFAI